MMNTAATFTQKTEFFDKSKYNEVFETDRLVLCPSSNSRDLEEYHRHLTTEGDFFFQYGMEMTDELLAQADFESNGVECYTIFLKDTGKMIGYVGLCPEDNEADIEFYIFKDYRNMGYCKEAAIRLINAYFDGETKLTPGIRVTASTLLENEHAKGLLRSIGFRALNTVMQFNEEAEEPCGVNVIINYVLENKIGEYEANAA